ncbi:hypothetical protein [Kitasatospora sp. NPDC059571]|uniref:hypothetical protein n=1 Tax=Kitasatospora sp. NPDC059571 TaxID=3346871 RepID=UPI0036960C0B
MLLPPDKAHFVPAETPLLLLDGAPVHDALPPLHAPDAQLPLCPGWSVAPMGTMCLLDGPGDAGCLIPAVGGAIAEPAAALEALGIWREAVERAGGAAVVSLPALPADPNTLDWSAVLTDGTARGGFVPALNP